jgi:hypothetical protein
MNHDQSRTTSALSIVNAASVDIKIVPGDLHVPSVTR